MVRILAFFEDGSDSVVWETSVRVVGFRAKKLFCLVMDVSVMERKDWTSERTTVESGMLAGVKCVRRTTALTPQFIKI